MGKCYVKAYFDWVEQTAALTDAERGRLFIAIIEYARTGEDQQLEGREAILFPAFKCMVDRDNAKSAIRAENGAKGGKQTQANASKAKQTQATSSKVKPNKEIRKKKEEEEKEIRRVFTPPTLEEVEDYVRERCSPVDPRHFFDYYSESGWRDAKGQPVRNWKQKLITWERHEDAPKTGTVSFADLWREMDE